VADAAPGSYKIFLSVADEAITNAIEETVTVIVE
jgi:hypothetical protein